MKTYLIQKKKHNLEKIISRKKFQDFKELIFPFIFYEDIKKILQPKGWEATEIKQYLDYMMVLKEISDIKKYERGRVFTKDQIRRIKINNNNKKGKIFDMSGRVTDKITVVHGGSPGLGKNKS